MEFDRDALNKANKGLQVIFIIMISVINLVLIVKQVRKPLFYQNVKTMIIFSLAIGDILFALFALVVRAELVYGSNSSSMTCRLVTVSETYMEYLIHFVYGIGLVILGAEVFLRHKIYVLNIPKFIMALFVSSIPWILGVIIILPLCLAKVDFDDIFCPNYQSLESMLGVSVFFPASLAVLVTIILNFVNFSAQDNNQFSNSNQPPVVYQPVPQQPQQPSQEQHIDTSPLNEQDFKHIQVNEQELKQYLINQPGINQYPNNQPVVYQYPSNQPVEYQYPSNQPGEYQYPSNQLGVYPNATTQQQTVTIIAVNNETTNPTAGSLSNRKSEVQRLLIIAIVFFMLVVPWAAVTLNRRKIAWPNDMTYVVVSQLMFWLMVLRSVLTTLIMISYSDL